MVLRPILELGRVRHLEGWKLPHRLGQIVKDRCYLVDNVCCNRLSDLNHGVNDKVRCVTEASGNSPMSRKPRDLGSRPPDTNLDCRHTSLLRSRPGSERNGTVASSMQVTLFGRSDTPNL